MMAQCKKKKKNIFIFVFFIKIKNNLIQIYYEFYFRKSSLKCFIQAKDL